MAERPHPAGPTAPKGAGRVPARATDPSPRRRGSPNDFLPAVAAAAPADAAQVRRGGPASSPAARASAATAAACPAPSSSTRGRRAPAAGQRGHDRPIGGQPVRPAIQRQRRLVPARPPASARRSPRARYRAGWPAPGRTARPAAPPSRRTRRRRGRPARARRVAPGQRGRRRRAVDAHAPGCRELDQRRQQQAAGAGAEVQDAATGARGTPPAPPRSASRCRRAGSACRARPAGPASRTAGGR